MSVVLPLRGVTALSDFRVEKLFQKAAALGLPEVKLRREFWYFVGSEKALWLVCWICWETKEKDKARPSESNLSDGLIVSKMSKTTIK